jgi:O-antigen ligase/polysaccharide polymerase Wzy-like membrane protein
VRPTRPKRPRRTLTLGGLPGLLLALVPVVVAVRLAGNGGGYTIDQWGSWAVITLIAAGVALVAQPWSTLNGVQRLLPLALAGLGVWSLFSVGWAQWPQSALVESGRYFFYAGAATLALVALTGPSWRRLLVVGVAFGTAIPALLVAAKLWSSPNAASLFADGRLVGDIGYGGGLAAAVVLGFWPLVALASDRTVPRRLRPLAAAGAGLVLATVVPTEARASVWALALSAPVFLALCPTPIRSAVIALGAAVPTLVLWSDLNMVFSSGLAAANADVVGGAIVRIAVISAAVGLGQVILDEVVELAEPGRRAVTGGAVVVALVLLVGGGTVGLAATDGNPVAWARHSLQRTVDRVGGEAGQSPAKGTAGSRFGSLDTGRYDLWKVAVRGFRANPAKGVGAGNFGALNVRIGQPFLFPYQAHSQLLEEMSTLGLPGLALFLLVLGPPLAACIRVRASAAPREDQLLAAGIAGSLVYFAVHGQVDWIWQIASVALPAIMLSAVAVGMLPGAKRRRRPLWLSVPAGAAALLAAVTIVLPAALAERYLERSYRESMDEAVTDVRRAQFFDRLSGRPHLALARARLRNGDTAGALAAARRAAGAEPGFWVAWQVLTIAAARDGHRVEAAQAERHVSELAPNLPLELRDEVPPPSFDHY